MHFFHHHDGRTPEPLSQGASARRGRNLRVRPRIAPRRLGVLVAVVALTSAGLSAGFASPAAAAGPITVENTAGAPFPDRVVLSRIQIPEDGTTPRKPPLTGFVPPNVVHDRQAVRIRNTGSSAVHITKLATTSGFTVSGPALPATIAAGASLDVTVRFVATSGPLVQGTLTITSDFASAPTTTVQLDGLWQLYSERNHEPQLPTIVQAFGYTTKIVNTGQSLDTNGSVTAVGDEVLSGLWSRADTSQPVAVNQLAAYHTQGNTGSIWWYPSSSASSTNRVFTHAGTDGQTVFPHLNGSSTAYAAGSFTPSSSQFGLKIDGEWSQDSRNDATPDYSNGCTGACGHHMRFWPAKDRSGALMANTWIVTMDYSGINYDFQDNVYLIKNIKPASGGGTSATGSARLPGAIGTSIPFSTSVTGSVKDADGQGTGFSSVQANRLGNQYQASRLNVTNGQLQVRAYGTSTAGSASGTDNTQVNALQMPFDARLEPFTVTTRVVGPLSNSYVSTGRAAGVFFGTDQDNQLKLQIVSQNNVPRVQLLAEYAAAQSQIAVSASALPSSTGAVDLALVGDPRTRVVSGLYRVINGTTTGAWQTLGSTTLTATNAAKLFNRAGQGGLYANAKGSTEYTAVFDSFSVAPDDPRRPDGTAVRRYDVGSTTSVTDSRGRVWAADTGIYSPSTAKSEGGDYAVQSINNTVDDNLFIDYRGFTNQPDQNLRTFQYAIPVASTTGPVRLRLYFAERYSGNNTAGKRVFSITAEGRTVATDFDPFAAAGGLNNAVTLTVPALSVTDGSLTIALKASADYPEVSAIEVVREP
ncbi:MAG: Di-glucose binding within endoplasmic reticulum [Frankiales bacterium]|nr:Di-glucose binding within endoplasmic reticulum [Frankiales bacterium]